MTGLRAKLLLGFGGLLLLLLATGGIGLYLLDRYSGTVDRVFRENYDSVVYGQTMKDAVDRIDTELDPPGRPPDAAAVAAAEADFSDNLREETGNITVPGEAAAVVDLTSGWAAYNAARAALPPPGSPDRSAAIRARILPAAHVVQAAAQRVIDLNLGDIVSADGQIRRSADAARHAMYVLLAAGILLAGGSIAVVARAILAPLRRLTASAREIGRGNLDLVVAPAGRDELGELAEAFNAMAGQLRAARRSDHHRLLRVQRTTQLALDSLPDAVAIVAGDARIDLANRTAQRLFNLRPGVALETAGSAALVDCWRGAESSAGRAQGFASAIQIFDGGEERFFLPHALPIRDESGVSVGVTLVLADITGLRRRDEMKTNLLAVVSHELKTPLTSLRMATHLLLDERTGALSAKQTELALAARADAERLQAIISGLLDISRLESGGDLLDLRAAPPRGLVDAAMADQAAAYRDRGVTLVADLPADLPAVRVDPLRLAPVFANLLGNALKYTPSGGRVTISAMSAEDLVEFRVSDTGPGIPPEHRARIFERFYRIPGQAQTGAGLGLAIVQEIVLAHHGRVWLADSAAGEGSTFCFTLPVGPQKR